MSEVWRNLFDSEDRALVDALSLSRVSISKKTGNMQIRLNAARFLTKSEYALVQESFASAFPAVQVETFVSYPGLQDRVQENIACALGLFRDILKKVSPGVVPFIDWSDAGWTLRGDALNIRVSSEEGAEYLKKRGTDRQLEMLLREMFNIRCTASVSVLGGEEKRIQAIAEARAGGRGACDGRDPTRKIGAERKKADSCGCGLRKAHSRYHHRHEQADRNHGPLHGARRSFRP